MALLEAKRVSMHFGELAALKEVSLAVEKGEILGLIGPNGAGKTTFFNCLTGFLHATRGDILFKGKNITVLGPHRICHMGICRTFQIVQSFNEMTVLENVMMGSFCRHPNTEEAMRKADEVIRFTGLAEKRDQLAGSLTLADQKRIELARTVATEPELVLLDEVMAGLNPSETEQAVELIRKVHQKGLTIIIVEHVMEVIMNISQRIAVFDSGEFIMDGLPEQVVRDERVVKAYLGEEYHA
ncbi:MAG: ABC transporter ATP-binding protein [Desulfobacterales bacterium]|jgi:branched-chain amino acid transport system ATP-binding protein